jgi:hypothetical protein
MKSIFFIGLSFLGGHTNTISMNMYHLHPTYVTCSHKLLLVQNKQQKNGKQILRTKLLLVQNKQQKNGKQILRTSHSTLLHGKRNARCNHQCELKHFNSCSER